jgi:hypothetical protein
MKRMTILSLFAGVFALSIGNITCADAQKLNPTTATETPASAAPAAAPPTAPVTDVTQAMLNGAQRREEFPSHERRLQSAALLSVTGDKSRQRQGTTRCLDFPN